MHELSSLLKREDFCRLYPYYYYCMHNPTGWIWYRHTHTHPHTTPITSLPQQCAMGAGQRRQSIDWTQRRRRWARRRRKPQAMSSGGGPIGNQCTRNISAPYVQNTRSDSCHSPSHLGLLHTERENVQIVTSMLLAVSVNLTILQANNHTWLCIILFPCCLYLKL